MLTYRLAAFSSTCMFYIIKFLLNLHKASKIRAGILRPFPNFQNCLNFIHLHLKLIHCLERNGEFLCPMRECKYISSVALRMNQQPAATFSNRNSDEERKKKTPEAKFLVWIFIKQNFLQNITISNPQKKNFRHHFNFK